MLPDIRRKFRTSATNYTRPVIIHSEQLKMLSFCNKVLLYVANSDSEINYKSLVFVEST